VSETLYPVNAEQDILPPWRNTPIGDLLRYHNLDAPHRVYTRAELLIGMCMDNRKHMRMPDNFAFILRTGGARLDRVQFKISFAIAVGGVRAVAVFGHDDCGMITIRSRREEFVSGLVSLGWDKSDAETHFDENVEKFAIDDPVQSTLIQVRRLRERFPTLPVAPLFYSVKDGRLYQIGE
jgi:carbonic anhydrase